MKTYYGKQTKLAQKNFPISGITPQWEIIQAIVLIKKAAAKINSELKLLEKTRAQAIIIACEEILSGHLKDQFIVDVYQAGGGTSLHMNVNEVIAARAGEILQKKFGHKQSLHPNDHVNMSQSSNDVFPTAVRIATLSSLSLLFLNLTNLSKTFFAKSEKFAKIIKAGRTHLQDALPLTLGQEFSAYAQAIENDTERIKKVSTRLLRIGIGATAVGTGINTHPKYHQMMLEELRKLTKLPLLSCQNFFDFLQNTADFLDLSASLRTLAQTLIRIGNDLRLLSSGPKAGFAEISLPAVQAGSSIMPGKFNPSIIEMLTMVCFQVIGLDEAILLASMSGQLELNIMLPLISYNLLEQIKLLSRSLEIFNEKCIKGIKANSKNCRFWFERSSGIAAVLSPYLGYDKTAQLVKLSLKTGKSLKTLVLEKKYLPKQKLDKIFSLSSLIKPNLE